MAQNGVLCVDGFIDRNIDGATLPADRQRYGMNIIHRLVDHAPRLIGRESVSEASQTWREADRICGSDSIRSIGRGFLNSAASWDALARRASRIASWARAKRSSRSSPLASSAAREDAILPAAFFKAV